MPSGTGIYRPMYGTVDTGMQEIIACHPESRALESGIQRKLMRPVVFCGTKQRGLLYNSQQSGV